MQPVIRTIGQWRRCPSSSAAPPCQPPAKEWVKRSTGRSVVRAPRLPWASSNAVHRLVFAGLRADNGVVVGRWVLGSAVRPVDLTSNAWRSRWSRGRPRATVATELRTYPLVGFLFCSKCGGKLRSSQKQNGKRAYSRRRGAGLGGRGSLVTLPQPVEDEIRRYVIGKLCDPKYRKQLARLADTAADESDSLADRLAEAEAQRDRLLDLYLEQKVTKAAYERALRGAHRDGRGAAPQGVHRA